MAAKKKTALRPATERALEAVAEFDWKAASAGRVPKVGAAYAKLVAAKPADRAKARAEILATAGEHPIGGLLAPHLVTMLADPAVPERAELLPLLAVIAVGKRGAQPFDTKDLVAKLRRSRRDRFHAVAAAVPAARELLRDEDAATRARAAMLLAYLQPDDVCATLAAAIEKEETPLALGALAVALVVAGGPGTRALLRHGDANVSLAAALALGSLPGPADDATLSRLEQVPAKPAVFWPGFPWNDGKIGDLARAQYLALGDRHGDRVIAHAIANIGSDPADAYALVKLLFPTKRAPSVPLTATQAAALAALVQKPDLANDNFARALAPYGLPADLRDLRDLAGLDVPAPAIVARPIALDGQTMPFHIAWLRFWWGRGQASPKRIAELGLAGLTPAQCVEAFEALMNLQGFEAPMVAIEDLNLPFEPRGTKVPPHPEQVKPFRTYHDIEPGMVRAQDFAVALAKHGWKTIYAPIANGNFGDGALAREDGVVLSLKTTVVWDAERPTQTTAFTISADYDPARVLGPVMWALHGVAIHEPVAALAAREDLANMPKWWTLSLATVLSELSGKPPPASADDLYRRCYVSWVPTLHRVGYLKVLPEARAEELALWLLGKDKKNTWLAFIVPTDKVKAQAPS